MNNKYKLALFILLLFGIGFSIIFLLNNYSIAIFDPKGIVASKQKDLILTALSLSLFVVIPVFILTFFIAFKYREDSESAEYTPDWKHSNFLELTWWAVPMIIIFILAILTWNKTHELDPFKPLTSTNKPMTIQVVALQWKWLFIYPEQDIATVNFVQFPADTPINFKLTADAPMNSFWIPQLGGQMYAMPGMGTELYLNAFKPGEFAGSAAEISGEGFAGMTFTAKASTLSDFNNWVQTVKSSTSTLDAKQYKKLTSPSENNPVTLYASTKNDLYNEIITKFTGTSHNSNHLPLELEYN